MCTSRRGAYVSRTLPQHEEDVGDWRPLADEHGVVGERASLEGHRQLFTVARRPVAEEAAGGDEGRLVVEVPREDGADWARVEGASDDGQVGRLVNEDRRGPHAVVAEESHLAERATRTYDDDDHWKLCMSHHTTILPYL